MTVRSGCPGHCSTIAQASEAEQELPSAVVDEARLVVPGIEDACSVGCDAEALSVMWTGTVLVPPT